MTRRNKRFLSLLLALTLAVSLCVLPAAAADQTCPSSKSDPVVFVHGLMGWGERAGLNSVLPYWGMTTGSAELSNWDFAVLGTGILRNTLAVVVAELSCSGVELP